VPIITIWLGKAFVFINTLPGKALDIAKDVVRKLNKNRWHYCQKAISTIIILTMISTMFVFTPPTGVKKAEATQKSKTGTTKNDFDTGTTASANIKTVGDNDEPDTADNDNVTLADPTWALQSTLTPATSTNAAATSSSGQGRRIVKTSSGKLFWIYMDTGTTAAYRTSDSPYTSWSAPISLTTSACCSNGAPLAIAIDGSDNIHITYGYWSTIYYKKLTYNAGSWTEGTEDIVRSGAAPNGNSGYDTQAGSIAINGGRVFIGFGLRERHADGCGGCWAYNSWAQVAYSDDLETPSWTLDEIATLPNSTKHSVTVVPYGTKVAALYSKSTTAGYWKWTEGSTISWSTEASIPTVGGGISATGHDGEIHIAAGYGTTEIRYAKYDGASWDVSPTSITTTTPLSGPLQINFNGTEHKIFYGDRTASPDLYYNVKYRSEFDWNTEVPLSSSNVARNPAVIENDSSVIPVFWTEVTGSPYNISYRRIIPSYVTSAETVSGFKIDAGSGLKAKWSSITWNDETPNGATVKFKTRGADSEAGLDGASWSDYYSTSGSSLTTSASRWLEVQTTLQTTDQMNAPTLKDFTVDYQTIDAPTNLTQYRYDGNENGSTAIADSGWGNESTAILKTDMTGIENGTLTPEIELRDDTSFTGTAGVSDVAGAGVTYTGASYIGAAVSGKAKVTGLTPGTYYWKVRTKDDGSPVNRVGSWSATYNTLKIDQTVPTGTVTVGTGNPTYVNNKAVTVFLDPTSPEPGLSGIKEFQLSNDGVNWGTAYDPILETYTPGWQAWNENYRTASTGYSWNLIKGAADSGTDGPRQVYVKYKDNAGNLSTIYPSYNDSFSSDTNKGPETSANWDTAAGEIKFFGSPPAETTQKPLDGLSYGTGPNFSRTWGYRFIPQVSGSIIALRRTAGLNIVKLWSDTGTLLGSATISAGQWGNMDTPVYVTAGTPYRVSVFTNGATAHTAAYSLPQTIGDIQITDHLWRSGDGFPNGLNGLTTMYGIVDIEFQPGGYQLPGLAQSITIDSSTSNINKATLTATENNDAGASVTYEMSADGGSNWDNVTSGVELPSFSNPGSDLKWRATLNGSITATPKIQDITVSYEVDPASDTIVLDTTAPEMGALTAKTTSAGSAITASSWQIDNDPYFEWSAPTDTNGIAGYYWAMDDATPESGGTWTTSTNVQLAADSVADGQHTFYVRAQDGAGNTGGVVGSFTIYVDAANPTSTVTVPDYRSDDTWDNNAITGTAADTGGSGLNKSQISVREGVGNYWNGSSFGSASENWIDVGTGGATSWSYGEAQLAKINLTHGTTYNIRTKTIDNATNESTIVTDSFTYDTGDPSQSITNLTLDDYGPATWPGSITGTASDAVTTFVDNNEVYIKKDSLYWNGTSYLSATPVYFTAGGIVVWVYNFSTANMSDGNYEIGARATDRAGNTSTAVTETFVYDASVPAADGISVNSGALYANTNLVSVDATNSNDPQAKARVSNDGASWYGTNYGNSLSLPLVGSWNVVSGYGASADDGVKTVSLKLIDVVNNQSSVYTDTITLDRGLPTSTITSPVNSANLNVLASTSGTATDQAANNYAGVGDDAVRVHVIKVGTPDNYWNFSLNQWQSGSAYSQVSTSVSTFSKDLSTVDFSTDGNYRIETAAVDKAGNVQSTATTSTVLFDDTSPNAPVVTSTSHPSQTSFYSNRTINVYWDTPTDPNGANGSGIDGYSYELDQSPTTDPGTTKELEEVAGGVSDNVANDGVYYFHIRSKDNSGNWSSTTHFKLQVDTDDPPVTSNLAADGYNETRVDFKFDAATDPDPGTGSAGTKFYFIERAKIGTVPPAQASTWYTAANNGTYAAETDATYGYIQVAKIDVTNPTSPTIAPGSAATGETGDAIVESGGRYEFRDSNLTDQNYYYYRIKTQDNSIITLPTTVGNESSLVYAYGKTNSAPQVDNITVTPISMDLGDNILARTVSVSFDVTDIDNIDANRDDSNLLNAGAWVNIRDGSDSSLNLNPNLNTEYISNANMDRVEIGTGTAIRSAEARGYRYTYSYVILNTDPYGTYDVVINAKDAVGTGTHDVLNTSNIVIAPEAIDIGGSANLSTTAYSAFKIDVNWTNPRVGRGVLPADEGIQSYKVSLSTDGGSTWSATRTVAPATYYNSHGYSDNKYHFRWGEDETTAPLTIDNQYTFKVEAIDVSNITGAAPLLFKSATTLKPAKVQSATVKNNSQGTDYRLMITWSLPSAETGTTLNDMPSGNAITYRVYRSTTEDFFDSKNPRTANIGDNMITSTNGAYDAAGSTDTTVRFFLDTNISSPTSRHYYAVTAVDNNDNESDFVKVSAAPDNGYVLGTPAVSALTINSATIKWTPNFISDSSVIYRKVGEANYKTTSDSSMVAANIEHSMTLSGLTKNTQYEYKVKSKDASGESEESASWQSPFQTADLSITHDPAADITATLTAAILTFKTNRPESFNGKILYGASYDKSALTSYNAITQTYTAIIDNLNPSMTYPYKIIVEDTYANQAVYENAVGIKTGNFEITSVKKLVTSNKATITWATNYPANSKVEYWTPGGEHKYSGSSKIVGLSNGQYIHRVVVENLKPGTTYDFKAISEETSGIEIEEDGAAFKTSVFKATAVSTTTSASKAIVVWKTNVSADSHVQYGINKVDENVDGGFDKAQSHKVVLDKLRPGTKYKYRVVSKDSFDNKSVGSVQILETKPFNVRKIKVNTSTNSTTITWKTNIASTSSVEYRSASDKVSQLSGDAKLTKTHKVEIKGLEDDTTYSYRIKSRDKEDNIAESKLLSFKTGSLEKEYDVTPTVSDLDEMELSATSAKIAWTTAGETSSWVEYGNSRSLGKNAGNDTMTVDHIVELTNLTPGITYYYRVKGEDEAGNKYQSGILTFTALVEPKITKEPTVKATNDAATITWKTNTDTDSIVEYGLTEKYGDSSGSGVLSKEHEVKLEGLAQSTTYNFKVGGVDNYSVKVMSENSTFKTSKDTTGPKIEDIRNEILRSRDAEGKEKISVIVNFTTNEEATSYIEYAEGITMATYNKKTRMNNTLNLSHSALIEGLNPATTYHYRIVTKDKHGNMTKSPDRTILTPKESETVLQKIIKVLEETFSWVSNLRDYLNKKVKSIRN